MNRDGGHTQLPGNGGPSGAYALVLAAQHNGSTPLIPKPSQFYPPPILTIHFPKIHLTN